MVLLMCHLGTIPDTIHGAKIHNTYPMCPGCVVGFDRGWIQMKVLTTSPFLFPKFIVQKDTISKSEYSVGN